MNIPATTVREDFWPWFVTSLSSNFVSQVFCSIGFKGCRWVQVIDKDSKHPFSLNFFSLNLTLIQWSSTSSNDNFRVFSPAYTLKIHWPSVLNHTFFHIFFGSIRRLESWTKLHLFKNETDIKRNNHFKFHEAKTII